MVPTLVLTDGLLRQIYDHVRAEVPREAVGLIGGQPAGRAERIIPLPNLAGPQAFFADPIAQYQAQRELKQAGLSVLAIYHSHPGGGANLSESDCLFASRWKCLHLVVVPEREMGDPQGLRAWQVSQGHPREARLQIAD